MKSGKSQSVRSVRSLKSIRSIPAVNDEDNVMDFEEHLATACKKFGCPYPVSVKKDTRQDDFNKAMKRADTTKYRKISLAKQLLKRDFLNNLDNDNPIAGSDTTKSSSLVSSDTIIIDALYDNMKFLVEIAMHRVNRIPRVLMQLLGLIVPYYPKLTRISITRCGIDAYSIYEMSKMLRLSSIIDICLDGCPIPEANYPILLNSSRLHILSLCRCRVNDEVCRQIASKLHYDVSDSSRISVLNLSSNHITDVGARHIAEALRTNRHLRYLNLADNRLTDVGACCIFDTFKEFPLTCDEIINKRRRYMDYLKAKHALHLKYLNEWESLSADEYSEFSKKSAPIKKRRTSATSIKSKTSTRKDTRKEKEKTRNPSITDESVYCRADMVATEIMGPFVDPFSLSSVNIKDYYSYCVGNMFLCYLNLSYNSLTHVSVKKLRAVLVYQAANKRSDQPGLVKIVLEGNNLPIMCSEMNDINDIINKHLACFGSRAFSEFGAKRKIRTGRVSTLPERNILISK